MVNSRRVLYGFTLIELMITLLLIGVLALMAGPYTINWMHQSDIQRAKGQLTQAHGIAKAAALRNPQGFDSGHPIVAIRLDTENKLIKVIRCPDGGSCIEDQFWSEQLPLGVELTFDHDVTNIEFDSTGMILGNSSRLGYKISKGGQNEESSLY